MNQSRGVDYDKQEELGGSEYENRIVSKEKKKKKLKMLVGSIRNRERGGLRRT